ncbi:cell division ATP-binding protein FtsE [Cryobacterium sp. TMT1-3]|uniref:Cell division ATP-binding protein FtsE n=1 Tax=Cryobacterium luteum TaxID=1424661 RepID=A0A1H8E7U3_9MICO|nr:MULTISPECIES: cell division ATP-binding protein FtsE [Cryobacterium]TFB89841.1 cell division ATP-binding protein FtsE [Cryobacterium luteum]TFC25554.1 cell division ATP-binding protein FtsE [Cryobacterium sp. TMT1-3]SEN15651.1 cell division transport system ATP-binding protein [Cryobacterium luteum]
MIRFDHITKKYPGTSRPALNSIDVEILRGEFVFLVGASGSGKSSCLRLVLKEEKPTSGSIHVLGQDLRSISNRKVPYFRRNMGVVFQDFRLLPNKTVFDNVAFSLQVIGKSRGFIQEAVPDTLKMVGLAEKAQRLPHELSGGEQQRVAIARAIVNKPQILLADEPTGNLDPTTSAEIMSLLASINAGGTTVIMATHEAGIVDKMQRRVIELVNGEIVRDERQGGYATASIPTILPSSTATATAAATAASTSTASADAPAGAPAPALPVYARPAAAAEPEPALTHPSAPVPETSVSLHQAAAAAVAAATGPVAPAPGTPLAAPFAASPQPSTAEAAPATPATPVPPMTRPVLPVAANDDPEQLTLAEKLGLRAPGEKPDQTGEQNVGPTR